MVQIRDEPETPVEIGIDRDTLAFIVLKARAFDAMVAPDDPSDASNSTDDRFADVLEDESDNPTGRELRSAIASLNVDQQAMLVATAWVGRGDYGREDWREAVRAARQRSSGSTARYLMGMPMLGDYIEDGAEQLGINLTDDEVQSLVEPDEGASGEIRGFEQQR